MINTPSDGGGARVEMRPGGLDAVAMLFLLRAMVLVLRLPILMKAPYAAKSD